MNIMTNRVDIGKLRDLKPGDVFLYKGDFYLFIETPTNTYNAVNLVTGKVFLWSPEISISNLPTASLKIL